MHAPLGGLFLLLLLLIAAVCVSTNDAPSESEQEALKQLIASSAWSGLPADWNVDATLGLRGSIPSALTQMQFVQVVNFTNNLLGGSIPQFLFDDTKMSVFSLSLSNNLFTSLPSFDNITSSPPLIFDIDQNKISGCLPPHLKSWHFVTNYTWSYCNLLNNYWDCAKEGCMDNLPEGCTNPCVGQVTTHETGGVAGWKVAVGVVAAAVGGFVLGVALLKLFHYKRSHYNNIS